MVCSQAMTTEQWQAWKGKGMCFPGMRVCSWSCQKHGKGKVERGQMTLETAESQDTDEMDNRNSAFASRQERRSTDGPYGQEKGKEGKGKDGHTDKGKGKGPHWSDMWDRDDNPVYIFDSEQQMRAAGAELGIIRCGSSDSSSPSE